MYMNAIEWDLETLYTVCQSVYSSMYILANENQDGAAIIRHQNIGYFWMYSNYVRAL